MTCLEGKQYSFSFFINHLLFFFQVGVVNCLKDQSLCSSFGSERLAARLFQLTLKSQPKTYPGQLSKSSLLKWTMAQFPNHSIRLTESNYEKKIGSRPELPRAILFTSKSSTPAMWQTLSGVFQGRIVLFETRVRFL